MGDRPGGQARIAFFALVFQDSADSSFRFKKETRWTYRKGEAAVEDRVVEERDGKGFVESREEGGGHTFAWFVRDGYLCLGLGKNGAQKVVPVFTVGSKKGDTWTHLRCEGEHLGTVELELPAGRFKDVVHSRVKAGRLGTLHFYFVAKVGLVKYRFGEGAWVELREFKEAK